MNVINVSFLNSVHNFRGAYKLRKHRSKCTFVLKSRVVTVNHTQNRLKTCLEEEKCNILLSELTTEL